MLVLRVLVFLAYRLERASEPNGSPLLVLSMAMSVFGIASCPNLMSMEMCWNWQPDSLIVVITQYLILEKKR